MISSYLFYPWWTPQLFISTGHNSAGVQGKKLKTCKKIWILCCFLDLYIALKRECLVWICNIWLFQVFCSSLFNQFLNLQWLFGYCTKKKHCSNLWANFVLILKMIDNLINYLDENNHRQFWLPKEIIHNFVIQSNSLSGKYFWRCITDQPLTNFDWLETSEEVLWLTPIDQQD